MVAEISAPESWKSDRIRHVRDAHDYLLEEFVSAEYLSAAPSFLQRDIGNIRAIVAEDMSIGVRCKVRDQSTEQELVNIVIQLSGQTQLDIDGTAIALTPGDWAIRWGPCEYSKASRTPSKRLVCVLPLSSFGSSGDELRKLDIMKFSNTFSENRLVAGFAETLTKEIKYTSLSPSYGQIFLDALRIAVDEAYRRETGRSLSGGSLQRARRLIERRFSEAEITMELIAAELGISQRYLNKLFMTGNTSPARFLLECRLKHAEAIIRQSDQVPNIAQIAYRCGFLDPSYFGRAFKKVYGVSPRQYFDAVSVGRSECYKLPKSCH